MKYLALIILVFHGLIHFMGFAKAFGYGDIKAITTPITKPLGILWMGVAWIFIVAAILAAWNKSSWWICSLIGVALSQYLIFLVWKDAKWGTIANGIILILAILSYVQWHGGWK